MLAFPSWLARFQVRLIGGPLFFSRSMASTNFPLFFLCFLSVWFLVDIFSPCMQARYYPGYLLVGATGVFFELHQLLERCTAGSCAAKGPDRLAYTHLRPKVRVGSESHKPLTFSFIPFHFIFSSPLVLEGSDRDSDSLRTGGEAQPTSSRPSAASFNWPGNARP